MSFLPLSSTKNSMDIKLENNDLVTYRDKNSVPLNARKC